MNCLLTLMTVMSIATSGGYIDKSVETKQIFMKNLQPEISISVKYNQDYTKRWDITKTVVCGDGIESVTITSMGI